MPFNGSGGTSQPANSIYPATGNTLIESAKANASIADLYTMLSGVICKDGQTTITANLPMAGFKHTGVAAASAATDYARYDQVQNGAPTYLSSVAGTNTVTATATPTPTLTVGQRFVFSPANTNTGATTLNISGTGAGAVQSAGVGLTGGELVAGMPVEVEVSAATPVFQIIGGAQAQHIVDTGIVEGRLTLTSGTPVTTSDVTAAETIYFTPFKGNRIALYTGTLWKLYTFTEISADVPDATQMNDVFIYDNAGTLTLDIVAWTNDTTRATALTTQNGVYVKTGATGRRYIGSFYSTTAGNGQTEDSMAKRYVWNAYKRVRRPMRVTEPANTWTYTLAAFRQVNSNTANQLDMAIGLSEDTVTAYAVSSAVNTNANVQVITAIGLDTTISMVSGCINSLEATQVANQAIAIFATWTGLPGVGRHTLPWLEYSTATGTTTWIGDNNAPSINQSGIYGEVWS